MNPAGRKLYDSAELKERLWKFVGYNSGTHHLKKTDSMRSKFRDPHQKLLLCNTNRESSLPLDKNLF